MYVSGAGMESSTSWTGLPSLPAIELRSVLLPSLCACSFPLFYNSISLTIPLASNNHGGFIHFSLSESFLMATFYRDDGSHLYRFTQSSSAPPSPTSSTSPAQNNYAPTQLDMNSEATHFKLLAPAGLLALALLQQSNSEVVKCLVQSDNKYRVDIPPSVRLTENKKEIKRIIDIF